MLPYNAYLLKPKNMIIKFLEVPFFKVPDSSFLIPWEIFQAPCKLALGSSKNILIYHHLQLKG